jgi:hypothetical protein
MKVLLFFLYIIFIQRVAYFKAIYLYTSSICQHKEENLNVVSWTWDLYSLFVYKTFRVEKDYLYPKVSKKVIQKNFSVLGEKDFFFLYNTTSEMSLYRNEIGKNKI